MYSHEEFTFSEEESSGKLNIELSLLEVGSLKFMSSALPSDRSNSLIVGIDPGRNFGMTIIQEDGTMLIVSGTMKKGNWNSYGEDAFRIGKILGTLYGGYGQFYIEGASYGDLAGQVGLSQVRFGFYLGIWSTLKRPWLPCINIVPPATARKVAFGNGNFKAWELWPELNQNAADSIGIALYGLDQ